MKIVFWRILLALGMAPIGIALGAKVGALFFVTRADGIAGGAMILWYGVFGAIIAVIVSVLLGLKLKGRFLPLTATAFVILAVVYYGFLVLKTRESFQAEAGLASKYDAIPGFSITMQRLDLSDPYLFVKMEVDSRKRKWVQTGPAPRNDLFTASIRAKTLMELRNALEDVATLGEESFTDCQNSPGAFIKQLSWQLEPGKSEQDENGIVRSRTLKLNEACLHQHPVINRALMMVERVSQSPMSDIKRK